MKNTKSTAQTTTPKMTIMEIIRSEHYYLVEALEHIEPGHELFQQIKNELFKKTGYTWIS